MYSQKKQPNKTVKQQRTCETHQQKKTQNNTKKQKKNKQHKTNNTQQLITQHETSRTHT